MIVIEHLAKKFNGQPVLRDVSLSVDEGEILVVIGRSGCGKSVLLKHIIGLIKPDAGRIEVDGTDITVLNQKDIYEMRKKFGMVFQGSALFDSMTVGENLMLGLREHLELSPVELAERVREGLALVGLSGIEEKRPAELSGGMKKRVGLARAMVMRPKYILFDEPTTGLDPIMRDIVDKVILDLNRKLSITAIVVTHDMVSSYKVAHRIVMLHRGVICGGGTPDTIRNTDDPVIRQFIDGSAKGPIQPYQ